MHITRTRFQLILGLLLVAMVSLTSCSQQDYVAAPDTTFTTITGKTFRLKQLTGNLVFITFWTTSCPSCIKEIPHWVDLYQRYHDDGLEIIAIAMFYDIPSRVIAINKEQQLAYDLVLDVQARHARLFGNVELTPTTFLISPDQKIVWSTLGPFDVIEMNKRIENLLKG